VDGARPLDAPEYQESDAEYWARMRRQGNKKPNRYKHGVRKGEARDVAQDDDGLITSGPDMFRLNCYDGANDPRHPNYTGPEVGRAGGLHGGF